MNNIEYIYQKVFWYGHSESIEQAAKIYLLGLGYDEVIICGQDKNISSKFISRHQSPKFDELLKTFGKGDIFDIFFEDKDRIGIPDLVAIKGENIIFVEVKKVNGKYQDSLSLNQLQWIENHPQYKVLILGLELEEKDFKELPQLEQLQKENHALKKELKRIQDNNLFEYKHSDDVRYEITSKMKDLQDIIFTKQLDSDKKLREKQAANS